MILSALAALALSSQAAPQADGAERTSPPNIVLILADDAGIGDFGCYGQKKIRTPNIDRLAAEGMRFTNFYAGGAVCVPSRCALHTGLHSGHSPIRENATRALPAESVTLAELLRERGYRNESIGKWALGSTPRLGSPLQHGFDGYFGLIDQIQAHRYYPSFLLRDDKRVPLADNPVERTRYSQDLFTEEALHFLEENRARRFFLYLPYCLPHADLDVPEDSQAPYRGEKWPEKPYVEVGCDRLYNDQPTPHTAYAGMVSRFDREVGRVLAKLDELGLRQDTLVLVSSDNGPTTEGGSDPAFFDSTGPYRGGKGELLEGGIRAPLVANWPGHIAPGTSSTLCASWDLLPTCVELAGGKAPADVDGLSLVPTLLGKAGEQPAHDYLYWEHLAPGTHHSQALRRGDWKLLRLEVQNRRPRTELYDLATDPGEAHDVAEGNPELVAELGALMDHARVADPSTPLLFTELGGGRRPRRK